MRQIIESPLMPCQLPESGQLSVFQTLGIVTELAINQGDYDYDELVVEATMARVHPALELGQAKVFLDDQYRPYGYASWITLPNTTHQSLLSGDAEIAINSVLSSQTLFGTNLWFIDLLSPFCSTLPMLRVLKQELAGYASAHLLPPSGNTHAKIRRVW